MTYVAPPDGWFTFGSFAPYPWVSIEFSEELDEVGMPLWERLVLREEDVP